jgi:hypothetical protein
MPNKKTITRTDNPDEVSMYKKGGSVKCYNEGSLVGVGEDVDGGSAGLGLPAKPKAPPPKAKPKKIAPKEPFNTITDLRENDGSARLKKGGKVNAAGNYTKPSLRKSIVSKVMSSATQGTGAGQWSARKAQLVAKKYKAAGGGYKD